MRDILDYLLGVYPIVLVLAFVAWVAVPRRSPRLARWPLFAIWSVLLVLGLPWTATGLNTLLARAAPPPDRTAPPELIVVPTGGIYSLSDGGWFPAMPTVQRIMAGLGAQQQWVAPVLLTGGSPDGSPPESEVTVAGLGLVVDDALMIETGSTNTAENALAAAAIADQLGVRSVLLVTSGLHVMRAAACLRHHGLTVSTLTADVVYDPSGLWAWLPSHRSMAVSLASIRELIGVGFYLVDGRLDLADL
ncbi:MAG: YdcF family protein [Alphaproteobacteria bacterium]